MPTVTIDQYEVTFDHQPEEPMTHDYPGCPESADICSITIEGVDVTSTVEIDPGDVLAAYHDVLGWR